MNIRKIYSLPTLQGNDCYSVASWADHDAMFYFVEQDAGLDSEEFSHSDGRTDERIRLELKAYAYVKNGTLEYFAISFDGQYVGLVVGVDRHFGWCCEERYVTNFPLYQAMTAYIRAVFFNKPSDLVGETTDIPDLDGRYEHVIDKRYKNHMRKEERNGRPDKRIGCS